MLSPPAPPNTARLHSAIFGPVPLRATTFRLSPLPHCLRLRDSELSGGIKSSSCSVQPRNLNAQFCRPHTHKITMTTSSFAVTYFPSPNQSAKQGYSSYLTDEETKGPREVIGMLRLLVTSALVHPRSLPPSSWIGDETMASASL